MDTINQKETDPLFIENAERFCLFPIQYPDVFELYQQSINNTWFPRDINLSKDYHDFQSLNENEKHFVSHVLAFFASSDGIVNENLVVNFYEKFQVAEIRQLYATQIFIEAIHSEVYSLLIDTCIKDRFEKEKLFKAITNVPCVQKKANWAKKYIDSGSFPEKMIAFLVVEGIFFSGSFCAIFWIKERNLLPGLVQANSWIARDEGIHAKSAVLIYSKLQDKLSNEKVLEIFKEAIEIEKIFVTSSLPVDLIGMNSVLMCDYIEFIGDFWLKQLGMPAYYNTPNPFPFMENINFHVKTNFFDKIPTVYQHGLADKELELTEDF